MATMTRSRKTAGRARGLDIELTVSRLFAQAFQAYLKCDVAIQKVITEMVEIINDPETDADDRDMALATIHEALFPACSESDGELGDDLEREEKEAGGEEAQAIEQMNRQEALFGERVEGLLKQKGWTQGVLAERIGVKQPAVSRLLSRGARPQKRTIEKIAEALGVSPCDLWPEITS